MIQALVILVGGYLLGSIPVAYLVVRKKADVDVREAGSGNVGGFNAYVATQSKGAGIGVGVLDGLKGLVAVVAVGLLFPNSFLSQVIALFGAIAGHNYSIWIGFKGGRGLSTTAGGLLVLGFSYTVVWCTVWLIARVLKRDILFSNYLAINLTPPILWALPWEWVRRLIAVEVDSATFLFFSCVLSIVLLVSHFDVVTALWKGSLKEQADRLVNHP